ncbi:hypothetical protein K1719_024165 [Acacia pycnantha]|nr:hypothetical protein K1719_024165 [Acacia pycnantha]
MSLISQQWTDTNFCQGRIVSFRSSPVKNYSGCGVFILYHSKECFALANFPLISQLAAEVVYLTCNHRFSIKGRVYPAILPVEDKKVTGRVLLGISDLELFILDEFEDVEYERRDVDVYLKDNSEKLKAHAYIWSNRSDPNFYGDWDFEREQFLLLGEFISDSLVSTNSDIMAGEQANHHTLKELGALDVNYQPLCIQYPDLAANFELKSGLIHLLPKFHGLAVSAPLSI